MKIDMTCKNVENKVFKALPDGDYNASIISTTLSTTNRPTLIVEFQLVGEKSVNGAMLNNRKEKAVETQAEKTAIFVFESPFDLKIE